MPEVAAAFTVNDVAPEQLSLEGAGAETHEKVRPEVGTTVLLVVHASVLRVPAVVDDQFDDVCLLLKSELLLPFKPI